MATMMLCYGIGAYMGCADYLTVPVKGTQRWYQTHPDYFAGQKEYDDPSRTYEWDIGNGFMSNLESAVMLLSMFFGFLRTIDLMVLFYRTDPKKFFNQ